VFSIHFDSAAGLLQVVIHARLSVEGYRRFRSRVAVEVTRIRARGLPLRVQLDLSRIAAFNADTARRIAELQSFYGEAGDRLAVQVASSMLKLEMRGITKGPRAPCEVFLSAAAARTWLLAYAARDAA
jgi:hypothetical protein